MGWGGVGGGQTRRFPFRPIALCRGASSGVHGECHGCERERGLGTHPPDRRDLCHRDVRSPAVYVARTRARVRGEGCLHLPHSILDTCRMTVRVPRRRCAVGGGHVVVTRSYVGARRIRPCCLHSEHTA